MRDWMRGRGSGQTLTAGEDYYVSASFAPGTPYGFVTFRTKDLSAATPILTTTTVSSNPVSILSNQTVPLLIGAYSGGTNRWSGIIDEVRITPGVLIESHLLVTSGILYQDWLNNFFTPAQQSDPLISGPDADPDNDGLNNTVEFGSGTYPTIPNDPPVSITTSSTQFELSVSFLKSPDITSILWVSDDLSTWNPITDTNLTSDTLTYFVRTKIYTYDFSSSPDALFFRTTHDTAE